MYIECVGVPNDRTLVGEWWVGLTGHCQGVAYNGFINSRDSVSKVDSDKFLISGNCNFKN